MKNAVPRGLALASACLFALALAACGSTGTSPSASTPSTTANPLESVVNTLSSPQAATAAQNLKTGADAIACDLSAAAATAAGVESQINSAGQSATNTVYVASTAACKLLGGTASASTVPVPAGATVVTVPAAPAAPVATTAAPAS